MASRLQWWGTSTVLVVEFAAPTAFTFTQLKALGALDEADTPQSENVVGGIATVVQLDGNRVINVTDQRVSVQHTAQAGSELSDVTQKATWVIKTTKAILPRAKQFNIVALGCNWLYAIMPAEGAFQRMFRDLPKGLTPLSAILHSEIAGFPLTLTMNQQPQEDTVTVECNLHFTPSGDGGSDWVNTALAGAEEYRVQVEEVLYAFIYNDF